LRYAVATTTPLLFGAGSDWRLARDIRGVFERVAEADGVVVALGWSRPRISAAF
jgi:hypothetical protein